MKLKIKLFIKKLLRRHKVRLLLTLAFIPFSFVAISLYRLFDYEWYKRQFTDDRLWISNRFTALAHYLVHGRRGGLMPHPLFVPEYFDSKNWQGSIIDPLTRYIVDKQNWKMSTSIAFNPVEFGMTSGRYTPPLVKFIKVLRDDTVMPVDVNTDKSYTWSDLQPILRESVLSYQRQELLRNQSRPVYKFDYSAEQQYISKYSNFTFNKPKNDVPLVSIIMPVWNREELVVKAIESAQAQTLQDWELVITDDGSTDGSVDVILDMQSKDSRIRLLQPGRGGVCKARNSSISEAYGQWIAFLDSDNEWQPDYLQTVLAAATEKGFNAAYSAIKMMSHNKTRYRTTEPISGLLDIGNYIDLNALVVRRSVIDEAGYFDESLRRMVDYDLVCRIGKVAEFTYVPIIGVLYTDHEDAARITTTELVSWDGVIKSKNFIKLDKPTEKDKLSIIVTVKNDLRTAKRALESLKKHNQNWQFKYEIIVADSSSSSAVSSSLFSWSMLGENIHYYRFPASHDSTLGTNYGLERATGEYVMIVDQRMVVEEGAVERLYEAVSANDDGLYAPLHLKPSRTVHTAGEVWTNQPHQPPIHFLENHPEVDTRSLPDVAEIPMATTGMYAISKKSLAMVDGAYPLFDKGFEVHDLSLRLQQLKVKTYLVKNAQIINYDEKRGWNTTSQKTFLEQWSEKAQHNDELWGEAGLSVVSYKKAEPKDTSAPVAPIVEVKNKAKDQHRWAIKISAPSDERRFAWGDLYYAEGLRSALEKLGQYVTIDYHNHHTRPTSYLDDVVLDLRGLDDVRPQKDTYNIMWVISHPEDVSVERVQSFDAVYAAGDKWARYMTDLAQKEVGFLPQCTNPEVFLPTNVDSGFSNKVVFVGNSRNSYRPIVHDAIESGADVAVYGGGWNDLIDKKYIKGTFIPNDQLATVYGSAKVVLNDHWKDMKQWGFLSNRLFDAAAAGAHIVTDPIGNVDEIFQGVVKEYENMDDLREILNGNDFPNDTRTLEIARHIAKDHSFFARAETLLADAEVYFTTDS